MKRKIADLQEYTEDHWNIITEEIRGKNRTDPAESKNILTEERILSPKNSQTKMKSFIKN